MQQECPNCGQLVEATNDGECPRCRHHLGPAPDGRSPQGAAGEQSPPMGRDRNLLFGVFAIQLRLISADDFVAAAAAWSADPSVDPGTRLVNSDVISVKDRDLVDGLVVRAIEYHDGDAAAAFDHLGGETRIVEQLTVSKPSDRDALERTLGVRLDIVDASADDSVPMDESPGRYTRDSEYSRGGMGRILLVHDEYLARDIALKELLPKRNAAQPESDTDTPVRAASSQVVRFLREARITGQLEHPSIVPVHEVGRRADGTLYYTMKLVRGETLAKALRSADHQSERLSYLSHFHDLCQAIAYAHSRGVIHRDIKPSNVMIGEFGETVVIDWGLAKVIGKIDEGEDTLEATWSQLKKEPLNEFGRTTPGARIGTPQYMAPEQAAGRISEIDERSDVFSLGVVLYEILTGDRPFAGKTTNDLFEQIEQATPTPVTQLAPEVPAELASICTRALQKSRQNRYPTAKELADEIERFLTGAIVQAYEYSPLELARRVYSRNRAAINTALAAALLICMFGVASYVKVLRSRNDAVSAREVAESTVYLNQIRLAQSYLKQNNSSQAGDVLWQTDPSRRQWEWGYLLNKAHPDLYTIADKRDFAISHDGTLIACLNRSQPVTIHDASNGQQLRELPSDSDHFLLHAEFSPDDSHLLTLTNHGQMTVRNTESWDVIVRFSPHDGGTSSAVFLPDQRILTTGNDGTVQIHVVGEDGPQVSLSAAASNVRAGMFSADAAIIAARVDKSKVQVWDPESGNSLYLVEHDHDIRQTRLSPDGTRLAIASGNNVELHDVSNSGLLHTIHGGQSPVTWIEFDSTGNRILVSGARGRAIIWDVDSGIRQREFFTGFDALLKSMWSPDERLICTIPYQGKPTIWNVETGQLENTIGEHTLPVLVSAFSPDSSRIITGSFDSDVRVWSSAANSSQQVVANAANDIRTIDVSEEADRLALLDSTGSVAVIDLAESHSISEFFVGSGFSCLSIAPNGSFIAATTRRSLPVIFDAETGEFLTSHDEHQDRVTTMSVSPVGDVVASAAWDGSLHLWNPNSGTMVWELQIEQEPTQLAFSPNGRRLAIGDTTGQIAIVNTGSESIEQTLNDHVSRVEAIAWSDNGQQIAAAAADCRILLYEYNAGQLVMRREFSGHTTSPGTLLFTDSAPRLLSCSTDGVRIWNTLTAEELAAFTSPTERSRNVISLGADGELMASVGPYLRRWTPVPQRADSSTTTSPATFFDDRRAQLTTRPPRIDLEAHSTVSTLSSNTRLLKLLRHLRQLVESASLSASVGSDGLTIHSTDDNERLMTLKPQDTIRSIAGVSISDRPSALNAIQRGVSAIEDSATSLRMNVDRQPIPKLLIFHVKAEQHETKNISLERNDARLVLKRLAEGTRQQLLDPPIPDIWSPGAILPSSILPSDRRLYRTTQLSPGDVISQIDDKTIDGTRTLHRHLERLTDDLESGELANVTFEVSRGAFRTFQFTYTITD